MRRIRVKKLIEMLQKLADQNAFICIVDRNGDDQETLDIESIQNVNEIASYVIWCR